jgi:hypothetical protein
MFRLVEETSGHGQLSRAGVPAGHVDYRITRFQGQLGEGGLPVPGLYRMEGELKFPNVGTPGDLVGQRVTLTLEDGRAVDVTLDPDGRFLTEGHHPRGCSCC